MPHPVEGPLKQKIDESDRRIRTLVYGYDAMRVIHMDLLARCLPRAGGLGMELGGGTGAVVAGVAGRFPNGRVQIWDTDRAMLAFARERCAPFNDRISFVARSFAEPLPACDAVVACIALHHVKDLTAKGEIYRHIFAALRPGGLFANADTMMDSRPGPREHYFNVWSRFQQTHGTTDAEARQNFADWAVEDYYPPLWLELKLLAAAGFAQPRGFWRPEHPAVFGCVKQ